MRMAALLITLVLFIEWFGRCALGETVLRQTATSADQNFTAKGRLLSMPWQCLLPRKQRRHLIQEMEDTDSQTINSKFLLEHFNAFSILSPKSQKSDMLCNSKPDQEILSIPPVYSQSSLKLRVSSNVPMFPQMRILSTSSSFLESHFSSSMSHSLKRPPGSERSPFSHEEAGFSSFKSSIASNPLSPMAGLGQLETSPLTSPAPSHSHSPCAGLCAPSPSLKLSLLPPIPNMHEPTRSIGQLPQPPASFVLKIPQERDSQMPSLPPASIPTAMSSDVHKSTSEPLPLWHEHSHSKSPPDCATGPCAPPYTQTPLGSLCGCVLPIKVGLKLSVVLYALFPSISVLAEEIASGILLLQSQVRVIGAHSDNEDQGKSIAEVNLVPLDQAFDTLTAILIYQRFWNHEVPISEKVFGPYSVMYVRYPGLPPSPPSAYADATAMGRLPGTQAGPAEQPLSIDVDRKGERMDSASIVVIALSATIAFAVSLVLFWALFLKFIHSKAALPTTTISLKTHVPKGPGGKSILLSNRGNSPGDSLNSSRMHCDGSMRIFSLPDLEKATNKFSVNNVVGEGGSGRVFFGNLEDGRKVAVKVLTREDQQAIKEFNAEVDTLNRLHHRNLVTLIGICREEHSLCLVYELISNGSVESHLHGIDRLSAPLDWDARMKIALGAARGLAYLHEDSNPSVIHRDFKATNVLLEKDFSPKISDFGLATAAPDEGHQPISTCVMGTFGYVAPEYAMTGHLLVKSDVYSYGVVLLELLSGRKPIDAGQPPGQENLVTWARPLLLSREGLQMLLDPALKDEVSFDSLMKVAAIASMCVQPEVSQRPFMGEVVQALKLVCNDLDASLDTCSVTLSPQSSGGRNGLLRVGHDTIRTLDRTSVLSLDYDSGSIQESDHEPERSFSISTLLSNSDDF